MNGLTTDTIVIDTCVFEHIFNDENNNSDGHIDELLGRLSADSIRLGVDEAKAIFREYDRRLSPRFSNEDDTGNRLTILRYWLSPDNHELIDVDLKGPLHIAIKSVIVERKEKVDRVLVAVACSLGRILVTNDRIHILWGPSRERPTNRRNRLTKLLRATKKFRPGGFDLLNSRGAHGKL